MEKKNIPKASEPYALAEEELAAIREWLTVQNTIGAGMPPVNSSSMATFMEQLDALSYGPNSLGPDQHPLPTYGDIKNEVIKGYLDQLYQSLIAMQTNYGQPFPALYIVHLYAVVFPHFFDPIIPENWYGFSLSFDPGETLAPVWRDELASLLKAWGQQPPANIIQKDGDFQTILEFEENVLGAGWTNAPDVTKATAAVWTAQADTARAMLKPQTLGPDAYFFMLHLLAGLATGDAAAQTLAQQIVTAPTTSGEHVDYTFIDQVIYLSLMFLVDQDGPYVWTNPQCQIFLGALGDRVIAQDPASQAIRSRLAEEGKKLCQNTNYPLLDPDNPTITFDARKTDTLYALDTTRARLAAAPDFERENFC